MVVLRVATLSRGRQLAMATLTLLLLWPLTAVADEVSDGRPNFVFVITDDQRWDYLGIAKHPVLKTPHIDRIGREGAWFRNFFTTTPLCSPSRASFLTGLYAHSHRIINNDKLGLDVASYPLLTWPRQLREAGYETAFIGKWHMGPDDTRRPGFDRWVSFKGQGIYIDGVANDEGLHRQLTGYMTDYLNQQAVGFVRRQRSKPFALVLSHKAVHYPYLPAPRHEQLYADYLFQLPTVSKDDLRGKRIFSYRPERVERHELEGVGPEPPESRRGRGREPQQIVRDQLRCLASVDEGVGEIFAALEAAGQLDNTVLIYTSDNGYLMGEHGRIDNKRWAYDPALRVPMLVRYPPLVAPGSVRDQLVLNVDVAPTMLELAGVTPLEPMHGQSFIAILEDPQARGRDAFLAEYFLEKIGPGIPSWQCIRTERWKYIRYRQMPEEYDELYDLQLDPQEERNLAVDPAMQSTLTDLRKQLEELLARSS